MIEPAPSVGVDDVPYLLPSEIARLVYGYLKQMRCDEVAEKFLNTSPHMKECLEMRNKHATFITKAHSLTLEEICNQCMKMNEMLLKTVNKKQNHSQKFHDAIDALKFVIDPSSSKDFCLVNEDPITIDDDASSDICLNINFSPGYGMPSDVNISTNPNPWLSSSSEEVCSVEEGKNRFFASYEDGTRPSRNLDKNAVLNKSGKVKVLRPRNSFPVVGKTINRRVEPSESDVTHNFLSEGESVSAELEPPPSPESPLEGNNNIDLEPVTFNESSLFGTSSKPTATNENVLTMQLRSQSAKSSEDSPATGTRSRRKKSSGSWNGEQSSNSKPSNNKIVSEIEVDHLLIQQTLIKNPKLHECIAQNINKAISESPQKKMVTDPTDELNSTVKKVTDETMNDPLCKEIINELLGCLTNVNLGLENETDDLDGSNLSFPNKFYGSTEETTLDFQSEELCGTNIPTTETNSNYQNIQNYVSISGEQEPSEIILVDTPEANQNAPELQNYDIDCHEDGNSNLNSNLDIRSYFTNTPDIKETIDSVETINGTVINVLESNCSNLIPLQKIEAGNQFCIARTMPLFLGSTTTSTTVVNSKKRSTRFQPCTFPTTRATRRLTPIAPKPSSTSNVELQLSENSTKSNQSKGRTAKKMKK